MDLFGFSLLYSIAVSILVYTCFCRLGNLDFLWYGCLLFTVLSCGLVDFRYMEWIGELSFVMLEILLLTLCGILLQKLRLSEALVLSSLTISIFSMIAGITQSISFWVVSIFHSEVILKYADIVQNVAILLFVILTFHFVMKHFSVSIQNMQVSALPILIIPLLFITLVEALVSDTIYGNSVIWDTERGLIFPVVNNVQLLMVRIFACGGLFSTLVANQKWINSIEREHTIQLLEQQTQTQKTYIKEASMRIEQTRSFRHDLKNHLLVLHVLLKNDRTDEARKYLSKMEEVSDHLSFQINSGNVTVDALLSSKLAIAEQRGISVDCTLHIPDIHEMSDLDWCIILSNALDNAISASEFLAVQERNIRLSGIQKGNIYFLQIENRCQENTQIPSTGIGLSNIKAVLQKYHGNMEIEIIANIFRLNILFIIPQHTGDILHHFY